MPGRPRRSEGIPSTRLARPPAETRKRERNITAVPAPDEGILMPDPNREDPFKPKVAKKEKAPPSRAEVRKAKAEFLQKNAGVFVQLAAQITEARERGDSMTDEERETTAELVEKIFGTLEKRASKNKTLKLEMPTRDDLLKFAEQYNNKVESLRDSIPVPESMEAKHALFRKVTELAFVRPEAQLETDDPLLAKIQARLQTTTRRAGSVTAYPRGSGVLAQVEKTGLRQATELAASWPEAALASAGFAIAAAQVIYGPAYIVTAPIQLTALAAGIFVSYFLNLPLKNAIIQEILQTGNVIRALGNTVKKNPIKSASIAITAGLLTGPVFNDSLEKSNTSGEAADQIAAAQDSAERNLALAKGETAPRAQVPIESVFDISNELFIDHLSALKEQVEAGLQAEANPEKIPALKERFPAMSFGESGKGGEGPVYFAKTALFEGTDFDSKVRVEDREVVEAARKEAGLLDKDGKPLSLAEAQEQLYQEYLSAINGPVAREGGSQQSRRERVLEILGEVEELVRELKGQTTETIYLGLLLHGEPAMNPEAIARLQGELKKEFKEITDLYSAFHAKAEQQIQVVQQASNDLVEGSGLSLKVPEFSFADALAPVLEVTPTQTDPRVTGIADFLAKNLGGEPEKHMETARMLNGATGPALALLIIFGPTALFTSSFLRRGRRTREDQAVHAEDVSSVEEEMLDSLEESINEEIAPYMPGFPKITRLRLRIALREFIAGKVVELADSPEQGRKIRHWLVAEFAKPGQVSEDTTVLQGFGKVLNKLRQDKKYGSEFLETLFPGYARLMSGFGKDLEVMALINRKGEDELTDKDKEFIRSRLGNPSEYKEKLDIVRLEAAYGHLAREIADTDVEYKCLEQMLSDIKVGADTYNLFGASAEGGTEAQLNRGITDNITAQQYRWTPEGGPASIFPEHQQVIRQVAEETKAAEEIQKLMGENRRRRDAAQARYDQVSQDIIAHQLKKRGESKRTLSLPKSVLNGEADTLRDQLSVGAGIFGDIAKQVRSKLENIPRERVTGELAHSVQDQLDVMAEAFYASKGYGELMESLRKEWGEDAPTPDLMLVYGNKAQATAGEGTKVDVPGFSFRFRLLKKNGEELRLDDDGNEIESSSDTRADSQDFQMGRQLIKTNKPEQSATSFLNWMRGARKALRTKATKHWLRERFLRGDDKRKRESQFTIPLNKEDAVRWIEDFYTRKALAYKRAERSRELLRAKRIEDEDLSTFFDNDSSSGLVPPRKEVERIVGRYYEKLSRKGLGRVLAGVDALRRPTLDLSEAGIVKVPGEKPKPLSDYR